MPLTVIQSKVLASHLSALRYSLRGTPPGDHPPEFSPNEVIGSLILELGPHVSPLLSEIITENCRINAELIGVNLSDSIDLIDKAEDELQNCIDAEIPPGRKFREIIAALLEQLMPILIKIIIGFLLEPDSKPTRGFVPPQK